LDQQKSSFPKKTRPINIEFLQISQSIITTSLFCSYLQYFALLRPFDKV